jgi:hypothetical protein
VFHYIDSNYFETEVDKPLPKVKVKRNGWYCIELDGRIEDNSSAADYGCLLQLYRDSTKTDYYIFGAKHYNKRGYSGHIVLYLQEDDEIVLQIFGDRKWTNLINFNMGIKILYRDF